VIKKPIIQAAFDWFATGLYVITPYSKFAPLVEALSDSEFNKFANEVLNSFNTGLEKVEVETMPLEDYISEPQMLESVRDKLHKDPGVRLVLDDLGVTAALIDGKEVAMKPYSYHYTFADDTSLHTVEVLRFNEKTQINGQPFRNCIALKNITIEGEICVDFSFIHSPLLSKESIISIVTHLSDTQGATLTLKAEAINNAFGGEYATEWIELITPKSNQYNGLWTINLV
jgi:hypothetical protein